MAISAGNSFGTRDKLNVGAQSFDIHRLEVLENKGMASLAKLPFSLRILLENLLRFEDNRFVHAEDIKGLAIWTPGVAQKEIAFMPARVLLQDFTGVPAVVDFATMRDAMKKMGGNPQTHQSAVPGGAGDRSLGAGGSFGAPNAFGLNAELEFQRNEERYAFLRWGQTAFQNFRVVPPDTGIVPPGKSRVPGTRGFRDASGRCASEAYPDTLVGTDSHTTMMNGLGRGRMGRGRDRSRGGNAGAACRRCCSRKWWVSGCTENCREGATATDLVLTVTRCCGRRASSGNSSSSTARAVRAEHGRSRDDRATWRRNTARRSASSRSMTETLAICGVTGRDARADRVGRSYCKEQGLFRTRAAPDPVFSDKLELDLATVEPTVAGPKRPQDRVDHCPTSRRFFRESAGRRARQDVAVTKQRRRVRTIQRQRW